jgi:hypothetical protein
MKSVEAQLIFYVQKNEHATRQTKAEASQMNERKNLVSVEVSEGNNEVVSEHGLIFLAKNTAFSLKLKAVKMIF